MTLPHMQSYETDGTTFSESIPIFDYRHRPLLCLHASVCLSLSMPPPLHLFLSLSLSLKLPNIRYISSSVPWLTFAFMNPVATLFKTLPLVLVIRHSIYLAPNDNKRKLSLLLQATCNGLYLLHISVSTVFSLECSKVYWVKEWFTRRCIIYINALMH